MRYLLIMLFLIGCTNPLTSEKHPNDNAREIGCETCHESK